ncbi:hypothetical protein ROHU_025141 [Labeo rohita]|uniref:Uncharacterized protein n=1 Tax=Labeo rohita TaxID=84645 RepID=A0A498ML97_LABRO|nr:hypothetical protein ROHU_025141 [Labeo rohita]
MNMASKDLRKGEERFKTLFFHLMPTCRSMGGDADHRNVRQRHRSAFQSWPHTGATQVRSAILFISSFLHPSLPFYRILYSVTVSFISDIHAFMDYSMVIHSEGA